MVITKLQGGLGNQMFQYAAAKGVSIQKPVYVDLGFLQRHTVYTDTFTPREFQLDIFRKVDIRKVSAGLSRILNSRSWFSKLTKRILLPNLTKVTDTLQQPNSYRENANLYFDGYFQEERYFKHIHDLICQDFTFPPVKADALAIIEKISNSRHPVSIHVRRGDYLKPDVASFHGLLSTDYYQKAVAIIESKIPAPDYFVFSDDIQWCKQHLSFINNIHFVSDLRWANWVDMYLMTLCWHNIIANSSYSWWGAWLGRQAGKITIAPEKWFAHSSTYSIPASWISL